MLFIFNYAAVFTHSHKIIIQLWYAIMIVSTKTAVLYIYKWHHSKWITKLKDNQINVWNEFKNTFVHIKFII